MSTEDKKVMDLSLLDATTKAEDGVVMELRHPTDNTPTGIKLVLRGTGSKVVKSATSRYVKIRDDERKSDAEKAKAADDLVVKCIVEIIDAKYQGEPLESTPENIRWFVETFEWAAQQILEFIGDLDNFLP